MVEREIPVLKVGGSIPLVLTFLFLTLILAPILRGSILKDQLLLKPPDGLTMRFDTRLVSLGHSSDLLGLLESDLMHVDKGFGCCASFIYNMFHLRPKSEPSGTSAWLAVKKLTPLC